MAALLPTSPKPASLTPVPMRAVNELTPAFGGPLARITRLGSRWAFNVEMPVMSYAESLGFRALLDDGPVRLAIDQPGIDLSGIGTPVVDGAGQTGSTLDIRGCNNGVTIPAGAFMPVTTNGKPYLYEVAEAVTTAGGGAAVKVRPLLRISPDDGDAVALAAPFIEGFATVPEDAFKAGPGGYVRNLRFMIDGVR